MYKDYFPNDNIIIGDAHSYLLENYNQFTNKDKRNYFENDNERADK